MPRTAVQFVVKISKLCNLRCSYCYEFNELGNKEKIGLDKLEAFFTELRRYALHHGLESVSFVWHGGEPLLVKLDYYRAIGALQRRIFGDDVQFWNSVQTNLTIMSDAHLEFLKNKEFFAAMGISFDVYGDQRVDIKGRLRTDAVLDNMQKLIDKRIAFGGISVLARNTLDQVAEIYRFYDQLGVECRFLPFYRSADDWQIESHSLAADEVVDALKRIFDEWLGSANATPVDPIDDYVDYAVSYLKGTTGKTYDKATDELVYIVNVDGSTWGVSETYDPTYKYGNVFDERFDAVLSSPGRAKATTDSKARMAQYCEQCPYFGHCPGFFIGDATPEQQRIAADRGCPVREVIDHIVDRLRNSDAAELIAGHERGDRTDNPALSVDL